MNLHKKWVFRIGLLFFLFILSPPLLLADNCSAPSDCFPTLAAAAAAAAGAGAIGAASSLWWRNLQKGFVYMAGKKEFCDLHAGPSSNSPVVASQPYGMRLVFHGTAIDDQGKVWYHVELPGSQAGWVSSDNTANNRPGRPAVYEPIHLIDTGKAAQATGGNGGAARG